MPFVPWHSLSGGKLLFVSDHFPLWAGGSDHRPRSTPVHHSIRSHSSRQVLAHCRCVHQRVPNWVSSRAAATENDFERISCRKILSARRVWNSEVTIKTRLPFSPTRHFSTSCDSSRVDSPSIGQIPTNAACGRPSMYLCANCT